MGLCVWVVEEEGARRDKQLNNSRRQASSRKRQTSLTFTHEFLQVVS